MWFGLRAVWPSVMPARLATASDVPAWQAWPLLTNLKLSQQIGCLCVVASWLSSHQELDSGFLGMTLHGLLWP